MLQTVCGQDINWVNIYTNTGIYNFIMFVVLNFWQITKCTVSFTLLIIHTNLKSRAL